MDVIKDLCHSVAVMEGGRIVEQGTVMDLFVQPQTAIAQAFVGTVMPHELPERVRRAVGPKGATYTRTVKAGSGISRIEVEEETTAQFFETVWPLTAGVRVHKRRYSIWEGNDEWLIDEFLDREGLVLAELELEQAEQVVRIPVWLAPVLDREVTNDRAYTNYALAR